MKAWIGLRDSLHYRREAFAAGFEACGYTPIFGLPKLPGPRDLLCIWNRYRENALAASRFEAMGRPVLVAENGYLGNELAGQRWYALSRNQHNGAGSWEYLGPERWDRLGVALAPWREPGGEIVILPQRGIGPAGVAMPPDWPARAAARLKAAGIAYRIRPHPGTKDAVPLERDLANASAVVTWGSGAALKALRDGVPAFSDWGAWMGAGAAAPLSALIAGRYNRSDAARLEMFRRAAWAMATLDEIRNGSAFRRLLGNRR